MKDQQGVGEEIIRTIQNASKICLNARINSQDYKSNVLHTKYTFFTVRVISLKLRYRKLCLS